MHVQFISASTGSGISRVRSLLDRYASRVGPETWSTPITEEALADVHRALRTLARRNVSVACYVNHGGKAMKLSWIVGDRGRFGPDGKYPISVSKVAPPPFPQWLKDMSLILSVAGLAHDLGKASRYFQAKLRMGGPIADSYRHEWLSLFLLRALRGEANWDWSKAWEVAGREARRSSTLPPFPAFPWSVWDLVDFLVLTHHHLFESANTEFPNNHFYATVAGYAQRKVDITEGLLEADIFEQAEVPEGDALLEVLARLRKLSLRLEGGLGKTALSEEQARFFWLVGRSALVAADHAVSAQVPKGKKPVLWANTLFTPEGEKPRPKQDLAWHLTSVAERACEWTRHLWRPGFESLGEKSLAALRGAPAVGTYAWQETNLRAVEASSTPSISFVLSATGKGKTRFCFQLVDVLGGDSPLRVVAAFNLRTLTTQTYAAYQEELGLYSGDVACVLGHIPGLPPVPSGEQSGETPWLDPETSGGFSGMPEWASFFPSKACLDHLVGAPVLVSTIDHIIDGADGTRNSTRGWALFRLATSDLILDEVDGYDPSALLAVCRMVELSALFGRNVVASSATLSLPAAQALYSAYASGARLRTVLGESGEFFVRCFDHLQAPVCCRFPGGDFSALYTERMASLARETRKGPTHRLLRFSRRKVSTAQEWFASVGEEAMALHEDWAVLHEDKRVSVGVIRVAHVSTAARLTKFLLKKYPFAQVANYHGGDLVCQRARKEKVLDQILKAKGPNPRAAFFADPEVQARLKAAPAGDVPFIIVVTPVEEIGRDHDFDWGIVEPSSASAIVQLCGRINRHRQWLVHVANVVVMRQSLAMVENQRGPFFTCPGYEASDFPYLESGEDMSALIQEGIVDLGCCFGESMWEFAKKDAASVSRSVEAQLSDYLGPLDLSRKAPAVVKRWYWKDAVLRKADKRVTYEVELQAGKFVVSLLQEDGTLVKMRDDVFFALPPSNLWLAGDLSELSATKFSGPEKLEQWDPYFGYFKD